MPTSPPAEQQQRIRAELVELEPVLVKRAAKLCWRLREPRPDPRELYNEVASKILSSYRDDELDSVRRIAFRILANVATDLARKYRFEAGPTETVPEIGIGMAPVLRAIWHKLEAREQCVLIRIHLEHLAVAKAFAECGWDSPAPHYRHRLVLERARSMIEELQP